MDIKRAPQKKTGRNIAIAGGVAALVLATGALSQLEPRAPSVERASLLTDSVTRGEMVREVRAPGTLVPERVMIISAVTAGRVEELPLRPGVNVGSETVLAVLSNPEVELQRLDAQRQVTAAESQYLSLRTQLETGRMAQTAQIATLRTQYRDAVRQQLVFDSLATRKLVSTNELMGARDRAAELKERLALEEQQLRVLESTYEEQLALQRAQVDRLRAISDFNDTRVRSMQVRAGESGALTEMPLDLGQWVVPGQMLARVAQPGRLKAVLRVPDTQARDIVVGQRAKVDTRNGIIEGQVMRIDPIVQGGTVTVEVSLSGELPRGARPDLNIDGVIEIERLEDVLSVARPFYGQAESTIGMFRLEPDGKHAVRVQVTLGASSVNRIQVKAGLQRGDQVIVSDMQSHESVDRVRIQ